MLLLFYRIFTEISDVIYALKGFNHLFYFRSGEYFASGDAEQTPVLTRWSHMPLIFSQS